MPRLLLAGLWKEVFVYLSPSEASSNGGETSFLVIDGHREQLGSGVTVH